MDEMFTDISSWFRKIVVHRYGRIDVRIAFAILSENLEDFNDILTEIRNLLKRIGTR